MKPERLAYFRESVEELYSADPGELAELYRAYEHARAVLLGAACLVDPEHCDSSVANQARKHLDGDY